MRNNKDSELVVNCGCWLIVLLINVSVGGWSVQYLIDVVFNKVIPFWGAALIGLFVGEFSIPAAIVVWLLKFFGVM